MKLLIKTYSCHPWTEGEFTIDAKSCYNLLPGRIFSEICRIATYVTGFVGLFVLVGNITFPNFKEEINV